MTNTLTPIEFKGQRLLTTKQLSEAYEANEQQIQQNANNHKDNFIEGIHYFLLQGEELKGFKRYFDNIEEAIGVSKFSPTLYLWTERGASRHCKILDTAKAWEQFDNLEATYFKVKEQSAIDCQALSPELQMFKQIFDSVARTELEQKQQAKVLVDMNRKLDDTCNLIALDPTDWRKETQMLLAQIARKLGGIEHIRDLHEELYKLVETRAGVSLKRRLENKRRRLAEEGVSKSRREKVNRLDVIAEDKKLIEVYVHIVKQMAAKYQIAAIGGTRDAITA